MRILLNIVSLRLCQHASSSVDISDLKYKINSALGVAKTKKENPVAHIIQPMDRRFGTKTIRKRALKILSYYFRAYGRNSITSTGVLYVPDSLSCPAFASSTPSGRALIHWGC